jgi:hypothetical protein
MSLGDLTIVGGGAVTSVLPFKVDDRTTSSATATHKAGEPVKQSTTFALLCADGDPEQGTDAFIGICQTESTETSTVDGSVDVAVVVPYVTRIRGRATTATNMNTDAKLLAFLQDAVCFDLANGLFTIDEDETDDPNVHSLVIVDGDITKGTLDVYVKPLGTLFGNAL